MASEKQRDVIPAVQDLREKGADSPSEDQASLQHAYEQDDVVYPTEEELATLRRVPDAVPWSAYLIAIVELAERFSFYGTQAVFTNFIQQRLPPGSHTGAGGKNGQSGALGKGQRVSTALTTFNAFWIYVIPLAGAFIADTRWGRFKTISWCLVVALVGHILLIIAAVPGVIEHPNTAFGIFIAALIIMGVGTGGFKANISPLVAEQYRGHRCFITTTKSGERVIVDPSLTISRIYMYFYLFINIGGLAGPLSMTFTEKYVGYYLAFTLPTAIFLLCPIVLWAGRHRYASAPPQDSVLSNALRVWRLAMKGRITWNPYTTLKRLNADDFWESAKPSNFKGEEKPKWMTFDDQWVDEVKRGFKACSVFLWYPIYWLAYNQLTGNLISQAATMQVHGLPNEILGNLDPLALIIFIPICDLFVYPFLRRIGISFGPIKRITLGFFTGAAAMIWATVVQHYIYKRNPCGEHVTFCEQGVSDLNVWIQSGSYILIAFSEIFASITGLEYAFTKAPKNMRSLVMACMLFTSAVSSALGEAFVALSQDPLLVWNYGVMAVLAGVSGVVFWLQYRKLDAQEDELNNLAEGHYDDGKTQ